MNNKTYCACTIDIHNGKTYWNVPKDNYYDMITHLRRYVHRDCHVIVYTLEGAKPMKFHEHISNFKTDKEKIVNA